MTQVKEEKPLDLVASFDKFLILQRKELPMLLANATTEEQRTIVLETFFDNIDQQRQAITGATGAL